ncbi:uncharacterized protein LOC124110420 isoform X1 [Haliotis rufescens]|uniref:uncharacterized protein LOC124110420 isoform X1 n=1 Tax=Haliotis rufescens TaxID=6454 RepID=UPI00201EA990|nr:uncharacterized protein LOC124110420 isoform X1 [Haliotis rufescens]
MGCGSSQSGHTEPSHASPHQPQPYSRSEENQHTHLPTQKTVPIHVSNDNTPDGAQEDRKGDPKEEEPKRDISTGEDTKHREESPNEDGPTTNTAPKDADPTEVDDGLVTESDMRGQEEETRSNDRCETNQEPPVMPEPLNEEPVQQEKSDGSEIPENYPQPAAQEQGQNDQEVLDGSENTDINQACSETLREPGSLNVHDGCTPVSIETIDNPKNDNADRFDERATAELQERTVSMEAVKQGLLYGDASVQCPKTAKIVRIFLSSTFTDTIQERNHLLERSYPHLKAVCKKKGYEFQLVDMRWGVGQGIANDHMTSDMCFREIKLCQQLSTGPNFVTLLSHKYGYYAYPRQIEAKLYRQLMATVTSAEDKTLMEKWFIEDTNADPPQFILLPVSTHYPQFMSPDFEVYNQVRKLWGNDCNGIINTLIAAAKEVFDEEDASRFILGVTEREIEEGILKNPGNDTCFWLKREIRDLDLEYKSISKYKDTLGDDDWALRNARLFNNLETQLKATLPASSVEKISVDWSDNAIDPQSNPKHREYIDELCTAFETRVEDIFTKAAGALTSEGFNDRLLAELAQHIALAQAKCKDFYGREELMKKIKSYLLAEKGPTKPLLIFGTSGSGKTTIIARTMKETFEWRDGNVAIVTRFIGTTRESSRVGTVLASMTSQIQKIYDKEHSSDEFQSFSETCERFTSSLNMATSARPLVVLLDSFEQLDPMEEAMNLAWIPRPLPPNVNIIISCQEDGDIKERLTDVVKPNEHKLEGFSSEDAMSTLKQWLQQEGRSLTNTQLDEVESAFARCSLPLFVRLTLQEALRWKSFSPPAETRLKDTVKEAVRAFFQRIEQNHGHIFTRHALGYITLARRGLSESELEDILSCDDEVLNEVFSFWVPPIRRLPPLILVRLKNDLDLYIAQREIDNTPVLLWNHQLFKDVARDMYCSDVTVTTTLHENLADFFSGKWSDCTKPFKDRKGENGSADRRVTAQPVMHEEGANLRKLNSLPWHLMQLHDSSRLNEECLFNIEFLTVKMKYTSVRYVIDDFTDAMTCVEEERKLYRTIRDAIQISQKALFIDVNELPTQLLNRLGKKDDSYRLLMDNCRKVAFPILICDQQLLATPGGNLQHSFPSHQGRVVSLDLTRDDNTAVTYGVDRKVMIWDVANGCLLQSFHTGEEEPIKALLAYDDQNIVVVTNQSLSTFHRKSGKRIGNVTFQSLQISVPAVCVAGFTRDAKTKMHVHNPFVLALTNTQIIKAGARKLDVRHMEKHKIDELARGKLGRDSICVGFSGYIAVTDEDRYHLQVFSLKDFRRQALTRVYLAFEPGENLGLTIDAICFSKGGDYLFVSNWRDGDILCLDLKDLKGTSRLSGEDRPDNFRVTQDEGILYFPSDTRVVLRDNRDQGRTCVAEHPCRVLFCATNAFDPLVTVGEDSVIRLWRYNASSKLAWPEKRSQVEEPANMIRRLCLFRNPRYALALKVATDRSRQVLVQDLLEGRLVRCATCKGNLEMEMYEEEPGNVTAVIRSPSGKLCILDLEHMSLTRLDLSTKDLSPTKRSFRILKKHEGIVAVSSGGDSMDIYDLRRNTQEKLHCEKETIENFQLNETETVLAVATEDGSCIVYNLEKKVLLFCLKPEDICPESPDSCDFLKVSGVTNDGKFLVLETEDLPKIWNIEKEQASSDLEMYWENGEYIELSHTALLPGNQLLAATDTGTTYVLDITTGHTLVENSFHRGEVRISSSRSDTYLTYGEDAQDQTIAVWSKSKVAPKATFTSDQQLDEVTLSEDGNFIIGCLRNPARIVTWHVQDGTISREKCMDGKALFRNEILDMDLKLDDEETTEDRYSTDDNLESADEEGGNLGDIFG